MLALLPVCADQQCHADQGILRVQEWAGQKSLVSLRRLFAA